MAVAAAQAQAHEGTNRLVFDLHRTLSWGFFRCLRVVPSLPPAAQAPGGSSGAVASPAAPQRPPPAMAGQEAPLGALNLAEYAPAGARTVDCYRRIRKIGEGTYG